MTFFAHTGHDHETQTVAPVATASPEPTAEAEPTVVATPTPDPVTTSTLSPDVLVSGATLLMLVIFWLLATYIFKLKLATRLSITMAVLLVVGMLGYQSAPVTSMVALAVGIAMALGIVLAQLGTESADKPKA